MQANDYAAITSAQTDPELPKEGSLRYAKRLDEQVGKSSLAELYKGRKFPRNADRLKLGGHAKELGHIHIDLIRTGNTWKLARIWMCR